MAADELRAVAESIVANDKGISRPTSRRGRSRSDSTRSAWNRPRRTGAPTATLFTTPGIEDWIGGVILYDETIRQQADDGTPFAELLASRGVVPGIKVDKGAIDLAGFPGEKVTDGLDGPRALRRIPPARGEVHQVARGDHDRGWIPTTAAFARTHTRWRYAAICQEQDPVPIVEPEVLMDADNSIERCHDATARTLYAVFAELFEQRVALSGILPKPNMVIARAAREQADARRIADSRSRRSSRYVPAAVPNALSGGQSEVEATRNLNEINRLGGPWPLLPPMAARCRRRRSRRGGGDPANVEAGRQAFAHRARMNALAVAGEWNASWSSRSPPDARSSSIPATKPRPASTTERCQTSSACTLRDRARRRSGHGPRGRPEPAGTDSRAGRVAARPSAARPSRCGRDTSRATRERQLARIASAVV